MEAVCERGNLMKAYERVVKNKGADGVDGIGFQEFKTHLQQHWPSIKGQLMTGPISPMPSAESISLSHKAGLECSSYQR